MKGKNFGNRKPENERPLNDFYQTPKCMTRELLNSQMSIFNEQIEDKIILDPCCGKYAIGNVLRESGIAKYNKLIEKDLIYGDDFLKENWCYLLYRNDCYKDDVLYKIPFIKEYKLQSKENNLYGFDDWIEE